MSILTDADHTRVTELYQRAMRALRDGRLDEAAVLARRALVQGVHSAPLLDCLGTALQMSGSPEEAVVCHRRALTIAPGDPDVWYNLGNALWSASQDDAAVAAFREALRLHPTYVEAHNNLGSILAQRGQGDAAIQAFRLALALDSTFLGARVNLGNALKEQGAHAGAEGCFRAALAQNPEADDARYGLANALAGQGRIDAAVAVFQGLLARRPDWLDALNNLYVLLSDHGRLGGADALALFARVVAANPRVAEPHTNLGNALRQQERLAEAALAHRRALILRPPYARAIGNLAGVRYQDGAIAEAIALFRRALQIEPTTATVQFNLAIALLAAGQWSEGWALYESRWKCGFRHVKPRKFPKPAWKGEPLAGRSILVHAEQGFGDAVQFARYAAILAEQGAAVVLATHRPLVRLLATVPGVRQCVAFDDSLPPFDLHVSMMSVPHLVGTTAETIPVQVPYLTVDSTLSRGWAQELAGLPGRKIGLVWAGDPRPFDPEASAIDRRRSMGLDTLRPLLALPGMRFLSLQKGAAADQILAVDADMRPLDFGGRLSDFADTAALIANLDLLISVDTAPVHVAGALGKPVWILSRFDGCWRWLQDRDDTPWYPSARLFRQSKPGDWAGVIDRVIAQLCIGSD